VCNAGTGSAEVGEQQRLHHSASYAQANLMWVVCCNAMGGDCYGTSLIVGPSGDPLVVLPTGPGSPRVATIICIQRQLGPLPIASRIQHGDETTQAFHLLGKIALGRRVPRRVLA